MGPAEPPGCQTAVPAGMDRHTELPLVVGAVVMQVRHHMAEPEKSL
jgi:hypothetical protein